MHIQNYHNNIIDLFNSFREFLYDEKTIIHGMPSYDYLKYKEKEIYLTNTEDIKFLKTKSENYKITINELNGVETCTSAYNFISEEEICDKYIEEEKEIINLGFDILVNYFVGKTLMKANYVQKLLDKKIIVGNFSVSYIQLLNDENLGLSQNKTLIFRMNLFNMRNIHSDLNTIFIFVIYQYINNTKVEILNTIETFIKNRDSIYIFLMIFFGFGIIGLILLYWVPKIKKMNVEIYKTKNMLSIIPVQILASLPDIKNLLNISKSNYL